MPHKKYHSKEEKEKGSAEYHYNWALHIATAPAELKTELLARGKDLRALVLDTIGKRKTLLHVAAAHGNYSVFKFILEADENPNGSFYLTQQEKIDLLETKSNENHRTFLHHLAFCGRKFSNLGWTNVYPDAPSESRYVNLTRYVLEKADGMGVDIQTLINVKENKEKWTPLATAACTGNGEMVDFLLSKDADITIQTDRGLEPLKIVTAMIRKLSKHRDEQCVYDSDKDHYSGIIEKFRTIQGALESAAASRRSSLF